MPYVDVGSERLLEWLDEQEGGQLYPQIDEESRVVNIDILGGGFVRFYISDPESQKGE